MKDEDKHLGSIGIKSLDLSVNFPPFSAHHVTLSHNVAAFLSSCPSFQFYLVAVYFPRLVFNIGSLCSACDWLILALTWTNLSPYA